MAVDMFMDMEGVKGEICGSEALENDRRARLSWGMAQSGTTHMGTGGGGKVQVHDLSFTKYVDSATPQLMLFCANGKHLKKPSCSSPRGRREGRWARILEDHDGGNHHQFAVDRRQRRGRPVH
jgi:type VI protein secretion system component Hcp